MPVLRNSNPKYRHHKASGKAVVTLSGQDHYLGPYGSPESREKYNSLVATWLTQGRPAAPSKPSADLSVAEMMLQFFEHVVSYYRRADGTPTSEVNNFRDAVRPLVRLYDRTRASDFGPLALKAVRQEMIGSGWARSYINKNVRRIKQAFKWAVSNELVPATVYHGLQAVEGLKAGRSQARETEPVKPVEERQIEAVVPSLAPQLKAMVELQLLTGMRPGEVCSIRSCDIDTTKDLWVYRPAKHKTQHHGHQREVFLGPKAKEVIQSFMKADLQAFIFSPAEVMAWKRQQWRLARKTPPSCGNKPGTNRRAKPKKQPGQKYSVESYCAAIARACKKADAKARAERAAAYQKVHGTPLPADQDRVMIPHWHPHQLRHNAATRLRKEFGLEAARVVLGHRSAAITEIYAEMDHAKAGTIMEKVG